MKCIRIFAWLAPLVLAGCCGLPEGTPPRGEIVAPAETRELSARGIENMLVTSLTGYLLSHQAPFTWRLDCDPELLPIVTGALNQLRPIAPVKLSAEAQTVLRARNDGEQFRFELCLGDTLLWQESAVLRK